MDIEACLGALPIARSILEGPDWEDACLAGDGLSVCRNLADLPFPANLDKMRAARLLARFETALNPSWTCPPELGPGGHHQALWLSAARALEGLVCGEPATLSRILVSAGTDRWLILNGLNHLECRAFCSPGALDDEYRQWRAVLGPLENREKFARHPQWGWLGPDPAWLGTGLRLRRLLCLPLLSASTDLPVLSGAFLGRRLALRRFALPGIPTGKKSAPGPWMVLESRSSLGTNEEGQLDELAESTRLLLHYEREKSPGGENAARDDLSWRAFGILSNARSLDAAELGRLAGETAWGMVHGSLDAMTPRQQTLLFLLAHQGVMEWIIRDMDDPPGPGFSDRMRAQAVRAILARHHGRE